ncbi:MAG: hypothetical protein QGG09_14530 [Pirellulaceae bacterium]|jgi:hypothetical protein|nr:hypothetical protein [Pirellulaceae bacterium]HJN11762.1 hypothetical protein [Pirellulaceae bacterium]
MFFCSTRMLLITTVIFASPVGQITPAESAPTAFGQVSAVAPPTGEWRRTSEGWQRTSGWPSMADRNAVPPAAKVHPLVLATLIGLISLGGLIGFGSPRRRSQ